MIMRRSRLTPTLAALALLLPSLAIAGGTRSRLVDTFDELVQGLSGDTSSRAECCSAVAQLTVERLERRVRPVARLEGLHLQKDGVEHRLALLMVR